VISNQREAGDRVHPSAGRPHLIGAFTQRSFHERREHSAAPPNKRLKLTGHSSPLSTVVQLGIETKRFQPTGQRAGSLAASR
jgi:hypothetical protein